MEECSQMEWVHQTQLLTWTHLTSICTDLELVRMKGSGKIQVDIALVAKD
jgi:hypothetical protein